MLANVRVRRLLIATLLVLAAASIVRIRHQPLDWGGYWYVEIVAPWQR